MLNFVYALAGVLLSILSFGILWAGVNQWLQGIVTLTFFLFGYFASRRQKISAVPFLLGAAAPLGLTLLLFRDKNDSHLLGFTS